MTVSAGNRVLMLIENDSYPLDIRVLYEATTLTQAGYQVSVICQRDGSEPWHQNVNGVFVYRYPAPPPGKSVLGYLLEYSYSFIVTFVLSLFVWARRGFDVIHAANPPDTAVFIALFFRIFGKRFVFDHHDLMPEMYLARTNHDHTSFVYKMLLWMERISFRYAHHVLATNQSYKNIAIQRGKIPEDRVTIVRNGPSVDRLNLVEPDHELKKRGKVIIGYIGIMGPQDGLDYLLRGLHQLVNVLGRKDFFCIIIGKGSALADLKNLAQELKLEDYIWFTGFIPEADMIRYLSTIDIGVDPDPANDFNDRCTMIKMMEYMTLSKPIVAFDLPEHRQTAQAAAIYATPNDELDFARKLMYLMDHPELRIEMGRIGRRRIENELAWSFQAKNLMSAYSAIKISH